MSVKGTSHSVASWEKIIRRRPSCQVVGISSSFMMIDFRTQGLLTTPWKGIDAPQFHESSLLQYRSVHVAMAAVVIVVALLYVAAVLQERKNKEGQKSKFSTVTNADK